MQQPTLQHPNLCVHFQFLAVNISARLLWMDFTVCSMIHNSQLQVLEKHEQQLPIS